MTNRYIVWQTYNYKTDYKMEYIEKVCLLNPVTLYI